MAVTRMGTGTTGLGANVLPDVYVEKRFVSNLKKSLVVVPLGKEGIVPANSGKKIRWQFMSVPTANTTALTEGADPGTSTDFTTTTAEDTLEEYGGHTEYSKFLEAAAIKATLDEFGDNLGYQAALTLDTLAIGEIDGSTTSVDAGAAMTAEAIRQGAAKLADAEAKPHRITGGRFYCGILTTDAAYDMMGEGAPTWFQVKSGDYVNSLVTPFDGTPATAAVYNVLIKTSNNVQVDTTPTPDDDLNVVVADDSFGVAGLNMSPKARPRLIITRPDDLVSAPLRNRGTVGWWVLFGFKLFDNARVVVVKSDI